MLTAIGRGLMRVGRKLQRPLSAFEHPITAVQTGMGIRKKRRQKKLGGPPKPKVHKRRPLGFAPPSLRRDP